ncbi:MAG: DUF2304 domain-containing protein [Patescibacteria group bacterium]|jgi:hypothetical protein
MLIQILLVLGFIFALWLTWKRFRQQVITLFEALAWSLLWAGGLVVSILPKLTEYLAAFFGVGRGVDLILYAAVAIQFFLIFKLFVSHEKIERLLTKLVQEQSLRSVIPAQAGIQKEKQNSDGSLSSALSLHRDDKRGMDPRVSSNSLEDDKV